MAGFVKRCPDKLAHLYAADAIAVFNEHQREFGLEALSTGYWSGQKAGWRLLVGSIPKDMNPKSVRVILAYGLWMSIFFANLFCIFIFANKS